MLLPMYFLIGIWGGPRREYAAIKFFIYTLFGSVFMLLVMIGLYFSTQVMIGGTAWHTFSMLDMMNPANHVAGSIFATIGDTWRYVGYLALFLGFAIKIPMFPFHTWLPDAHVEAPTAISVILAGVLVEDGHVWNSAHLLRHLPGDRCRNKPVHGDLRIYQYCLWRVLRNGAKRSEEAYCL